MRPALSACTDQALVSSTSVSPTAGGAGTAKSRPAARETMTLVAVPRSKACIFAPRQSADLMLVAVRRSETCHFATRQHRSRAVGALVVGPKYGAAMAPEPFVPPGFEPPTSLVTDRFRLEPLGPQHNEADHAAWTSSIEHIRATPGYPDGKWPPPDGMSLEANLADLRRHAADFAARRGFTFTVLDPSGADRVIGCVYLYPTTSPGCDVTVQSWVSADRADLDVPLAEAVAAWIAAEWPWKRVDRCGR